MSLIDGLVTRLPDSRVVIGERGLHPEPLYHQKESPLHPSARTPSQTHHPAPLTAYRLRIHKEEFSPRTPTTPSTSAFTDLVEPPSPAYCRESASFPVYHPETPQVSPS